MLAPGLRNSLFRQPLRVFCGQPVLLVSIKAIEGHMQDEGNKLTRTVVSQQLSHTQLPDVPPHP